MTEKQYIRTITGEVYDTQTDSFVDEDFVGKPLEYEDGVIKLLNELSENLTGCNKTANNAIDTIKALTEENQKLKETLNLVADAHSFTKEESVKDILRHAIYGLDTVAGESANAFHDYMILSRFFKEHYKEHWDND